MANGGLGPDVVLFRNITAARCTNSGKAHLEALEARTRPRACAARLGKLIDAGRDVRALGAGRWGVIPTVGAGAAAAQRSVLEQQADASL